MRALILGRHHLGRDFTRLWTASAVSNIGDGVTMAAGPLLVASVSGNPAVIAGAAFVQQLPWLLFALLSGALVDRLDRQRLVVAVNLLRAVALAVLTAAVATGNGTVALIYAVLFLLGTGETLADTAMSALLPSVVTPDHLPAANARLYATFTIGNQFLAKPLGGWLFVLAAAAPFGVDALTFAVAAALLAGLRVTVPKPIASAPIASGPVVRESVASGPRPAGLREEIAEGVRWLLRHRLLRTLAVGMGLGNVAFAAAFAVFVLYCRDRLGLSEVGYGVLLTAFAAGGLAGTLVAARLTDRFGVVAVLRFGLFIEAGTHAVLALTTSAWVAAAIIVGFSIHGSVWGITVTSLRQRLVPDRLRGRVGSVLTLMDLGGAALGSLLGGLLAGVWSITTPFWSAAAAMTIVATWAWRRLGEA